MRSATATADHSTMSDLLSTRKKERWASVSDRPCSPQQHAWSTISRNHPTHDLWSPALLWRKKDGTAQPTAACALLCAIKHDLWTQSLFWQTKVVTVQPTAVRTVLCDQPRPPEPRHLRPDAAHPCLDVHPRDASASHRAQNPARSIEFLETTAGTLCAAFLRRFLSPWAKRIASLQPPATLPLVFLCHVYANQTTHVSTRQAASTNPFGEASKICCDGWCCDLCSPVFAPPQPIAMASSCRTHDDLSQFPETSLPLRTNVVHRDTRLNQTNNEIYLTNLSCHVTQYSMSWDSRFWITYHIL